MNGIKREYECPVLTTAVRDEEKEEMLSKTFVKIPSLENISEEGKQEGKL